MFDLDAAFDRQTEKKCRNCSQQFRCQRGRFQRRFGNAGESWLFPIDLMYILNGADVVYLPPHYTRNDKQ